MIKLIQDCGRWVENLFMVETRSPSLLSSQLLSMSYAGAKSEGTVATDRRSLTGRRADEILLPCEPRVVSLVGKSRLR